MACFQILDYKDECIGYFVGDQLIFGSEPSDSLSKTWSFHPKYDAEFAQLYVNGTTIQEAAPTHIKPFWEKVKSKKEAFIRSFQLSKIDLNKHCFYDLVPESFLHEYNYIKNEVTKHVFAHYEKPANYDFLLDMSRLAHKIRRQPLNFNQSRLLFAKANTKANYSNYIDYNIFGTVTGRLTTSQNSFPILTLNKKYRDVLEPHNNYFLELDINAAEIRTFLALLGKEQPQEDIHEWNRVNIYNKKITRDEAKTRFFAWFYNQNNHDKELLKVYDRDYLLQRHYNGKTVQSPFGRTIQTDDFHALNYLVQSSSNDIILRNILKLDKLLTNRKSFISFMIHDSVIIDWHSEDISLLKEIRDTFAETEFGTFLTNVRYGTNFGDLNGQN